VGHFRVEYDPDERISLPRPFQLGGEGKTQKAQYLHGAARTKKLDIPTAEQANKLRLYPNQWLKNLPHKAKNIAKRNAVVNPKEYNKAMARALTGRKNARAGFYIKVRVGEQWAGELGRMVPIFEWDYVPNDIYDILSRGGESQYAQDPRKLLPALKFLYKYGYDKSYRELALKVKRRVNEIRRGDTDEWRKWAARYNAWRDEMLKANRDDRNRWNVS